jgi:hypothetical protein
MEHGGCEQRNQAITTPHLPEAFATTGRGGDGGGMMLIVYYVGRSDHLFLRL